VRELLTEVMELNRQWSSTNTPAMQRRGQLVRRDMAAWLGARRSELATAIGVSLDDLVIEGRDGTGQKSEIPWIRFASRSRSPNATKGWYAVYLFSAVGGTAYLSLNQGTTIWTGTAFVPRPEHDLVQRFLWARGALRAEGPLRHDLVEDIELSARRTDLGPAYEAGNVFAIRYDADAMPPGEVLERDVRDIATLLGVVYHRYAAAPYVPGDLSPEVFEAVTDAERAAGLTGDRRGGQGFGLSVEQRDAVEFYAVRAARAYLKDDGWETEYVGDTKTWDIEATRGSDKIFVEVKGTTSPGDSVILTGPQVRKYRRLQPRTALIVVHGIELDRTASPPVAQGGRVHEIRPWTIEDEDLEAISVRYTTGI
jgi:hypothetical protein